MSIQTLIEAGPFIAGTAESLSGEQREITNPGTGELVGRVTDATAQDADRAVAAAQAAFRDWARLGYADRGRIIHACAEAFEAHVDELTPILVAEQGKTIREAKIELRKAADTLEHYAGLSRAGPRDQRPQRRPRRRGAHAAPPARRGRRDRPVELPHDAAVQQARPRLPGGQHRGRQARRHDARSRRCAWPRSSTRPGLPAGVLTSSPAPVRVVGEALVKHPGVRKVAFTGSTPVGERVHALAAEGSKRVTLELGGIGPDDHLRRRRPQEGRQRRRDGPLLQLRPGVPGDQAAVRLRERGRRGHRGRRGQGQAPAGGDRQRLRLPARPDAHRAPARDHGAPDRRVRGRDPRRRRAPRRPRRRLVPRADGRRSSPAATRRWRARRSSGPRCRSGA